MIKRDAETPMPRLGLCVLQQRVHGCIRLHVNGCIPCTHSMASHIHKLQARVSRTFAWFAQCANRPRGYRAHKNLQFIGFSPATARDERFRLCTTWARPYADRKYASSSIHPCKATACVRHVRCGWGLEMEANTNREHSRHKPVHARRNGAACDRGCDACNPCHSMCRPNRPWMSLLVFDPALLVNVSL